MLVSTMAPSPRTVEQAALDKKLGECLRARRRELGLTVLDVAVKSGVSHDHVYRLEQGRHSAQGRTMRAVAKALKTTVAELSALAAQPDGCKPRRRGGRK